jgi:hypothetical protein
MGKTKKANYDKTKHKEVQLVQVTNNEEDGNSFTIYSMDKNNNWNLYNNEEDFQKDPHAERTKKSDRIRENQEKKKKEFIKGMKANALNNQKLTNEQKMNPYNSKKAWYTNNARVVLPDEVYNKSDDEEEEEEIVNEGSEEELEEDEYKVHKVKNNKKLKIIDSSDEEEENGSDDEDESGLEEGTHVIVTVKKGSKKQGKGFEKKQRGNKGNKHKETF